MSERIEKLRAKQGGNGAPAKAPEKAASSPKKEKVPVQGSCGHFTKRGKPGEPCGACRNAAEVAAAKAAKGEKLIKQSGLKAKSYDAEAWRLPSGSRFDVVYAAGLKQWSGTLTVPADQPFQDHLVLTDKASGVFTLLRKLDLKYRAAMKPATEDEPELERARRVAGN